MNPPFFALLSGDSDDVAQVAAALHAGEIQSSHMVAAGSAHSVAPEYCPPASPGFKPNIILELTIGDTISKRTRIRACEQYSRPGIPLLSASVIISATEQATWMADASSLAGFSYLPAQFGRTLFEIAPTLYTARPVITAIEDFLIKIGKEVSIVQDRIGLVLPRVLSALVNEAFFAVMEGAAVAQDIDTAMKLGTNYPRGPFEWGQEIGLRNVVAILDALYRDTGEDRYRVAPLLRQLAFSQTR